MFRDPLELERGPLRRGGPRKQKSPNRETKADGIGNRETKAFRH